MFGLFRKNDSFFPALTWRDIAVLVVGLAAFVGITASTVTKFSIWFDEAFGSYMVRFDFWSIARYTANDVHPPLYYWLLKIWTSLFGNTELGLRSMSIFFGVIAIVFAFLLAHRLFGRKAAYLTLLLLIISPLYVRYSQEARMYTLLTAEVVAATYMLVYASSVKKRWPWTVYGVLVALGMLTQYFAAFAWVTHWVWRYFTVRSTGESFKKTLKKVLSKDWIWAYGLAIVLFLPWLPFMAMQFFIVQGFGFWIPPVTSMTLPNFLSDALMFTDDSGVKSWLALAFYMLLLFFAYAIYHMQRTLSGSPRRNYALMLLLIVVPTVILLIISMPPLRSAFIDRYLLPSVVFLAIVFAATLTSTASGVNKKLRVATALVLVGVSVVGVVNQATIGNYNKANGTAHITRQLVEAARATDATAPIIANSPWVFYEAAVYTEPSSTVYFDNAITSYRYGSLKMLQDDDTFKIMNLGQFTKQHKTFWVIGTNTNGSVQPLDPSWHKITSVTVNDYLTNTPEAEAILFTAS